MARLDEVYIDFSLAGLFDRDNPGFDEVKLKEGELRIITHGLGESPNLTIFIARLNEMLKPEVPKERKSPLRFNISHITLEKTAVDVFNYTISDILTGFDYGKLRFRDLVADAEDFYIKSDTISFKINFLRGEEATSGLDFQQLKANFTYSNSFMEFDNLLLVSNQTRIKDYLRFDYANVAALGNFNEEVDIRANLDQTILDLQDLKVFSSNIPDFDDRIYLSGEILGKVSDLFSEELLIRFGERTALFGKFSIKGLPVLEETFFRLSLVNSTLRSDDLTPYISPEAEAEVSKFRDIRFDTEFTGFLNNFSSKGSFRTSIGNIEGNLNFRLARNVPTYSGNLAVRNLDLGILTEERERFQKVTFNGRIQGTGLTANTALISVNANVRNIGFRDYNYQNIQTNATYGKDLFSGELNIKDPNVHGNFKGTLDLRNGKDSTKLVAMVDTLHLQPLGFADRDISISGKFDLDTKGITVDDVEGIAKFSNVTVGYDDRSFSIDNFFFQSLFTMDRTRMISLNSDPLVAGISGNFKISDVIQDMENLFEDYKAILTNKEPPIRTAEQENTEEYTIDISLNLYDINPLIHLIEPKASISKGTKVEGAFYKTADNTVLNFYSSVDTLIYNGNLFLFNDVDLNTAKLKSSSDVLAAFYVNSKKQRFGKNLEFDNFSLESLWNQSSIGVKIYTDQLATGSYANISSNVFFYEDNITILVDSSDIKLIDKYWHFDEDNYTIFTRNGIEFNNLKAYNENQFISVNGLVSTDPEEALALEINDFNLEFFNTLGPQSYTGTANGMFAFSSLFDQPIINGNLSLGEFYINNFLIGDINASTYLENSKINLTMENFREDLKVIEVNGFLATEDEGLQLRAIFDQANLSVLEPFLSNYITEMGGNLSGGADITGSLTRPIVNGTGRLDEGTFRINYLNTLYKLNGNINFSQGQISFQNLAITDVQGNQANMTGDIKHAGFRDFVMNIGTDMRNFQVLNTTLRQNKLFYGLAYATGRLDIKGEASNLDIIAKATSQPNTRIYIPIGSTDVQAQEDYIRIINVRDTASFTVEGRSVEKLAINNIRMNFDLDVTPDAYVEIQIDPRTGENIQGRGKGVLKLNIDTQGEFSMTGNYEITDAKYNFSLYNVVRKEFKIEPGGRISWFGDPYEGIMDIRAIYQENIALNSLQTLQVNPEFEDPNLRRRFPVRVNMDLRGNLLSPDIGFAFDFSEFPEGEIQTTISAFNNRIANDEQEKIRQVFSVIMLRRFSPEGQFAGAGIGFSNLSQLVSSQLNSLVAQVDQNLEIDFDLGTLDEAALESFQLRLAYTFLDGRLRVTRDGGFTDPQGNSNINTIAGDWQAEYLLSEDGRYRIRVYNRTNFNNVLSSLNLANQVNTYGVAFSQNISFNSFKELVENIRKSKNERLRINDTDDFLRYGEGRNPENENLPLHDAENDFIKVQMAEPKLPIEKEE